MKVRELLSDESKWTRRRFAATTQGTPCLPRDRRAAQWCLYGAIERCYGVHGAEVTCRLIQHLQASLADWNDDPARTFADVKRLVEELDI
jgi:hypothetical protein